MLSELKIILSKNQIKKDNSIHPLGNNGSYILTPQTEDEIASILNYANQNNKKVIPVGGGTKQGFGGIEEKADILLSLSQFKGIVEHTSGDLTMTVRSGTTMKDIGDHLSEHQQMISIDTPWPEYATIGGVIASNDSGPRRLRYGSARDFVIGLRVVYSDGRIIRTGGKVVKNVAGYDMNKMFVGSMGTLGVISEVTLKLRPLPKYESLMVINFADDATTTVRSFIGLQVNSVIEPSTLELLTPDLANVLTGKDGYILAIAFEDREKAVRYQEEWVKNHLPKGTDIQIFRQQDARDWWEPFSQIAPNANHFSDEEGMERAIKVALKIGSKNSDVLENLTMCHELGESEQLNVKAHGGLGHGISHIYVEGDSEKVLGYVQKVRSFVEQKKGYVVIQHMPLALRRRLSVWGEKPSYFSLLESIKRTVDPNSVLNPKRFVGGL